LSEPDSSEPDRRAAPSGDRDAFYLAHMLECIESIERYSAAHNIELDELTQDAVLRKLQILAESSNKRISEARKAEFHRFDGANSPDSATWLCMITWESGWNVFCRSSATISRHSKLRFWLFWRQSESNSVFREYTAQAEDLSRPLGAEGSLPSRRFGAPPVSP